MKYTELFRLSLAHQYYRDGQASDVDIVASGATRALVRNHRGVLKYVGGGLRVLLPLNGQGELFLPLASDAALLFHLVPGRPDFPLFTDLSPFASQAAPLFTNLGAAAGETVLQDQNPVPPGRPRGTFADVRIVPAGGTGLSYEVAFSAKSARWAYYCVTDLVAGNPPLRIVPAGAGGAVSFSDGNRRELRTVPDPDDRIAVELARRYPEKRRVRFLSDEAVLCREQPGERLELHRDGHRVLGPIPVPPLKNYSTLAIPPADQPGAFLFEIVRHISQPFPQPGE